MTRIAFGNHRPSSPTSAVLLALLKNRGLPQACRMHWPMCLFTPSFLCLNSINIYIGAEGVGCPSVSAGRGVSLQTQRQPLLWSEVPVLQVLFAPPSCFYSMCSTTVYLFLAPHVYFV